MGLEQALQQQTGLEIIQRHMVTIPEAQSVLNACPVMSNHARFIKQQAQFYGLPQR